MTGEQWLAVGALVAIGSIVAGGVTNRPYLCLVPGVLALAAAVVLLVLVALGVAA